MSASTGVAAPSGLVAMTRAVTGLRARWDRERDLGDVLDLVADAYLRTSLDGTIIEANEIATEQLGTDATGGLVGRVLGELVAPWEQGRFGDLVLAARHEVATARELAMDCPGLPAARFQVVVVTGQTGETHWLLRPLPSLAEELDLHPAEMGLRVEAIDRMPAVTYVTLADPAFTPQFLAPTLENLVGATPTAWVGNPHAWVRAIHPDDRLRVHEARLRAQQTGVMDCSYRLRTADGRVVWVADRAHRAASGDRQRWFGALMDVTHARNLAELAGGLYDEVHDRAERAETIGQAKHTALELFAHDLRSPLTAAVTLVDDLVATDTDAAADLHASLQASLATVTGLLDDVRSLQSLGGGADGPWEIVDLGKLATELVHERGDARVSVEAESCFVEAIPTLLRRAIGNVVDNALRHVGPDGTVVVRALAASDGVVVVDDDGPGIPADLREHLFDPFVRGSGLSGGLGLGLALVRRITEMHGGRIQAENRRSGGARFELSLPVASHTGPDVVVLD